MTVSSSSCKYIVGILILLLCAPVWPAQDADHEDETESGTFGLGLLDQTQSFASEQANSLAGQLDRFFGVPRSDLEAAYSSLRLTLVNYWNEIDGVDTKLRVRGKVHLPRINERISLIFSEDDGDSASYYEQSNNPEQQQQSTKLNLELNLQDSDRHRLDFRLGLRSSLQGRASMRYRYENTLPEGLFNRFAQTAYFKDGLGFGSITRYQLERPVGDEGFLRWTNDLRFEESYTGALWSSGLAYSRRHSQSTAMSYYTRISGETSPGYTNAVDVGIRARKNIARPWLFVELEPGYTWQKHAPNEDREGSPYIFVRFEMAIGRLD